MKAALVGDGIGLSLTPGMHEAEGAAHGLAYSYERFDTALPPWSGLTLTAILDRAEAEGYLGLNITFPHKVAVVEHLDALSGAAEALGSVNTVVFREGRRIGHTTDYSGFAAALREFAPDVAGKRIVQFGAGGAGSATALALVDAGANLTLVDREHVRADTLADRLRRVRPEAQIATGDGDLTVADGALNATPLGMSSNPGMAFDPAHLPRHALVADIVYFPIETALVRAARSRGLRVMTGGAMALHQAVAAFDLITGHTADAARMGRSFETLLAARDGEETAPAKGSEFRA